MSQSIKSTGYDTVLPVYIGEESPGGEQLLTGEVLGTSFGIGGGFLLTAAHVVSITKDGNQQNLFVGFADHKGYVRPIPITHHEQLPNDIALLQMGKMPTDINVPFFQIKWDSQDLDPFAPVSTIGYPYGMHKIEDQQALTLRAFLGHIVSRLIAFRPIGFTGPPFRAYELSFIAPRGLSGAPLFKGERRNPVIKGLIIGNSESKMMVYQSSEHIREAEETTIVEQYETMTLGIAVTAGEILAQHSSLLGVTIGEHLKANRLI